jgi:hypothetical protein
MDDAKLAEDIARKEKSDEPKILKSASFMVDASAQLSVLE